MLNKLKHIFWPINSDELPTFFPLAMIMFCILCNFGIVRSLKDSIIVPSLGAEVISFLKLWFVLPSAVIFTLVYVKLNNILSIQKIYYLVVGFFCSVFLFFAYHLYPNENFYHLSHEKVSLLVEQYPYFQWPIKICAKWSYAIMYVFADLWSAVVINLMFWQFCNYSINTKAAQRFYPTFGMIGNIGLVFAGVMLVYLSDLSLLPVKVAEMFSYEAISPNEDILEKAVYLNKNSICASLKVITVLISIMSLISVILFKHVNDKIFKANYIIPKQPQLSISDSIKLILSSSYIWKITLMVICYGLAINILEGPWKAQVKKLYPEYKDYLAFMGEFNIFLGITAIGFTFIGNFLFYRFSWLIAALFSPVVIGITGSIFFILIIYGQLYPNAFFNPIVAAVVIGSIQNIVSKSSKYSVFDASKEITYLPLSVELKSKGKATVEIIGAKIGKSLGAVLQSGIFIVFPNISFDNIILYLLIIFIATIIVWIINVYKLNTEYHELIKQNDQEI